MYDGSSLDLRWSLYTRKTETVEGNFATRRLFLKSFKIKIIVNLGMLFNNYLGWIHRCVKTHNINFHAKEAGSSSSANIFSSHV